MHRLTAIARGTLVVALGAFLNPTIDLAGGGIVEATGRGVSHVGGAWRVNGSPANGLLLERNSWGDLVMTATLVNGVEDGVERRWFSNGRPESMRTFDGGQKVGVHVGWWPNGALRFRARYDADRFDGVNEAWYETGARAQRLEYEGGHEEGLQQMWTADGALIVNYDMRGGRRFGMINAKPCIPSSGGM